MTVTSDPAFFIEPLNLSVRRTSLVRLWLYSLDATALALAVGDKVRAKVWSVDDSAPEIDISEVTPDSVVTIVDRGVAGTTPAEVTVKFHENDTDTLDPDIAYKFELILVDSTDSNLNKPLCRADVIVNGTATGAVGP